MDMDQKEGGGWKSVPAFGDWDMKNGVVPDYSMDFTKIREMRKQNKNDLSRASIGNEMELIPHHHQHDDNNHHRQGDVGPSDADDHHHHHHHHAPTTRKKIMNYFNCCLIGV